MNSVMQDRALYMFDKHFLNIVELFTFHSPLIANIVMPHMRFVRCNQAPILMKYPSCCLIKLNLMNISKKGFAPFGITVTHQCKIISSSRMEYFFCVPKKRCPTSTDKLFVFVFLDRNNMTQRRILLSSPTE